MRNWTKLVIVLLIITNLIFIGTTVFYKDKIDNQVLKVYTFEGAGNDYNGQRNSDRKSGLNKVQ